MLGQWQRQNNIFYQSFITRGEGGVSEDVKELLGFFINQVFVGVFQYDSGTQKPALELNSVFSCLIIPKCINLKSIFINKYLGALLHGSMSAPDM